MALTRRIVVVGLGSIGRRHARLLSARGDLAVEWCESSAQILDAARKELPPPARVHDTYESMLGTTPDMVVIATPHAFHVDQSIAALNAGAHVLCEKPMADGLPAALRLLATSQQCDRVLTFGFHLHFHPGLRRLRELVKSGALGNVLHVHCRVGTYATLLNSRSRHQALVEGALLMDYAHQPDLLHWILPSNPIGVYAAGGQGGKLELTARPNFITVVCDYPDALISTIHLNYVQMPERHEYEIVGDEGWAHFDLGAGILRLGHRESNNESREQFQVERDPVYCDEHQAFLDAVDGKRLPESPANDAIASMRIIAAALQSWRNQSRVTVSTQGA